MYRMNVLLFRLGCFVLLFFRWQPAREKEVLGQQSRFPPTVLLITMCQTRLCATRIETKIPDSLSERGMLLSVGTCSHFNSFCRPYPAPSVVFSFGAFFVFFLLSHSAYAT